MSVTKIEFYSPDHFMELESLHIKGKGEVYNRRRDTKSPEERERVKATLQKDRGIWCIRGRVYNPETGQMEQKTKSTGLKIKDNTKRKAEAMLRETVAAWEEKLRERDEEQQEGPLFAEYLERWMEWKKGMGLKANTLLSYREYLDKHILPQLGTIPVQKLELKDLEDFYREYLKEHKVNSARKLHVVISGALARALRDGVIEKNVADRVEFPKAQKYRGAAAYNDQEVHTLLEAARKAGEPICAAVTLAVCYGLRRSEVVGLRWKDIDFEKQTLTVANTVVQNGSLRIEDEQTKTSKSHRTISLIGWTVPYLKELRDKQRASGLEPEKVCAWPDGRELRPDYLGMKAKKLMHACGLKEIRFHDLRHTAASLLAPYVSPKQLQEFLGHEDIRMTYGTYAHVLDEQKRATSETMDSLLKGERAG